MRKLISIVHISLDGFVAAPDGSLAGFNASDENLAFVCQLTEEADAALFGRISYELLNEYWPTAKDRPNATTAEIAFSNWYNNAKKIVVSKTLAEKHTGNTIILAKNIAAEITKLKTQPGKDILIFGSPAISQICMRENLTDSYWIFINPVIFGKGIPFFTTINNKINLALSATQTFANGEKALHYIVNS